MIGPVRWFSIKSIQEFPIQETHSSLAVTEPLTHPLNICRQSCSWSCSCCHSTGTGSDRLRQAVPKTDSTEPRTFPCHMTARPSASSYWEYNKLSDFYPHLGEMDEQLLNLWHKPVLSLASIQPVVLGGAHWACTSWGALWTATEANPEVSISSLQLTDEPLYQPLLAFCLDAE